MSEITIHRNITLDQLPDVAPHEFFGIDLQGTNPVSGNNYEIGLYTPYLMHPASIHVETEKRSVFLTHGNEAQAQDDLIEVSHKIQRLSGGVFSIHPFYGAVFGTKIETVAPGFCDGIKGLDDQLSTRILFTDTGYDFDPASSREAQAIGLTVEIPSANGTRLLKYMQTAKANPNQKNRDQAIANQIGDRWDAEFERFNGSKPGLVKRLLSRQMDLTPLTIAKLVKNLGNASILTDVSVDVLRTVTPSSTD